MLFNSFDDVVSWYDRVKPLVSKNHSKDADVRPIGDRKRKWERVKKIDDNTYALLDGNYGNTIWGTRNNMANVHAFENTMAPIVWMRREDGDFIRIRNHANSACSVTRYNFLRWQLPSKMRFCYDQSGRHWVSINNEEVPLPKCKVRFDYNTGELHDDNTFLTFRANEDGTFTRVGDMLKVEVRRVDRELKKQWRERIEAFYQYCGAIAPMIDLSWTARNEYANMIREHLTVPGMNLRGVWVHGAKTIPPELMREVVAQEDHAMRVAVAALVIADIGGKKRVESEEELRRIKAAYNNLMNKAMGLYKIEEK